MNRSLIFGLSLCVFYCFAGALGGVSPAETDRDYLVHVWQTDKGLPQDWVSSMAQTPDGYLWVGTRYGGLARFDGVRFVPFNQQNTGELKDVQVEHLTMDSSGRLWIVMGNESLSTVTEGRLQLVRPPRSNPRMRLDHVLWSDTNHIIFAGEYPYLGTADLSSNQWYCFIPPPAMEPDVRTFTAAPDGSVWFITQDKRLARFAGNRFSWFTNALPESRAVFLAAGPGGQPWLATPRHLAQWDGQGFREATPTNGPRPEEILQICAGGEGSLWVLEPRRLRKLQHGQWTAEIASDHLIGAVTAGAVSLHGDSHGNAWLVANGRGLLHCKTDGTIRLLTEKSGLPSRFITCWFEDAEGNIWIGMHGGGIARIRERLFHEYGQADGLPDKMVSSVCTDARGDLWAGTMSGTLVQWQNGRFVNAPLAAPPNDPNQSITVFPADGNGVWVGSLNHGLTLYRDGRFSTPATPWDTVRILFGDREDRLWVGGLVNLFCLTNGGYKSFGLAEGFVDSHAIGALAEDAAGTIWIGTGPGELWKYAAGRFRRFRPPPQWPLVRFASLLPDANGAVWVGTLGGGLLHFKDGEFTRCLKADGLPDNNVPQLLDSRDGYLWGGTYAGVFRAKKADLEAVAAGRKIPLAAQVYGQYDGLPASECSSGFQPSCWRSADGLLWFSTANGVASVDPARIVPNPIPPTVIIEEMSVDGHPVDIPPRRAAAGLAADSLPAVTVPPGRHYVQFRFTGLSFADPDGVRFRVRLEGGDSEWQAAGGQRQIGYGPLSPGNYRFRVLAANTDGIWNEEGDALAFSVRPYFWETWWFRTGGGVLGLALFGLAAALVQRQRYRRRLERAERQREMEQERARIARDLHDDLGTTLTQINLLSALANRETTPAEEARELIDQVRDRTREMVIALDEIVWAVNPRNDSLTGLVSYLGYFAEEFYRSAKIRFRLDIPEELPEVPLSAEARHHLFLAFKEAVNNTARHSQATLVQVRVEIFPDRAAIRIQDNGRGFDPRAGGGGDGLINMQRRLEQIGGHADLRSMPGEGTTVTLVVRF